MTIAKLTTQAHLVFLCRGRVIRIVGGAGDPASCQGPGRAVPEARDEVGVVSEPGLGRHGGAGQAGGVPVPGQAVLAGPADEGAVSPGGEAGVSVSPLRGGELPAGDWTASEDGCNTTRSHSQPCTVTAHM